MFASDVGVDDAALQTKDRGYLWFEVVKVDPARDRTFEEVKDVVEKQWRADEVAQRARAPRRWTWSSSSTRARPSPAWLRTPASR